MRAWSSRLIFFSISLLFGKTSLGQGEGAIGGLVLDEGSAPVVGANVSVDPVDGRAHGSLVRSVETDASGRFVLDRLSWGKYKVLAKKEDAGYPDLRWSLYSDDMYPMAEIGPSSPKAAVCIQLGPRAGILTGLVSNARTGAPVGASFRLTRSASPRKWILSAAAPDYRVLLPSSTDVLLEVSAPGFKTWKFPSTLNLQPGAEMHLDIALEPAEDPSLKPSKFLVPDGYVGWLGLEHDVKGAQPVPIEDGMKVFKFPENGVLDTSSPGPQRGAEDEYFFYSSDGSLRQIPGDYRNGKGMIWGQYQGSRSGVMTMVGFFVGTEEQYKKYQTLSGRPGPIPKEPEQQRPR